VVLDDGPNRVVEDRLALVGSRDRSVDEWLFERRRQNLRGDELCTVLRVSYKLTPAAASAACPSEPVPRAEWGKNGIRVGSVEGIGSKTTAGRRMKKSSSH